MKHQKEDRDEETQNFNTKKEETKRRDLKDGAAISSADPSCDDSPATCKFML